MRFCYKHTFMCFLCPCCWIITLVYSYTSINFELFINKTNGTARRTYGQYWAPRVQIPAKSSWALTHALIMLSCFLGAVDAKYVQHNVDNPSQRLLKLSKNSKMGILFLKEKISTLLQRCSKGFQWQLWRFWVVVFMPIRNQALEEQTVTSGNSLWLLSAAQQGLAGLNPLLNSTVYI